MGIWNSVWEMLDLLSILQTFVVVTCVTVLSFLMDREKSFKKKNGIYTLPEWNFFLKKKYAQNVIEKIKAEQNSSFKIGNPYETEEPKALTYSDSSDSQSMYGCDEDGNTVHIKLKRKINRLTDVWIMIKLKDGTTFTLPDHPNTTISNVSSKTFEAGGLKLECLAPYSRWRITYVGNMRIGMKTKNESDLHFMRFNFFWIAASNPIHWPLDWSTQLMATALATEPWKSGDWKEGLFKTNCEGYDQYGALFGQISIQSKGNIDDTGYIPKVDVIEVHLPGIRQRRWGSHKDTNLHRKANVIGVCNDGSVFKIGAFSSKSGPTHAQYGSLRTANGMVFPIHWTNFHLSSLAENPDAIPLATVFDFTANGKMYKVVAHFRTKSIQALYGGRPFDWKANNVSLDISLNGERGRGVVTFWYPINENEPLLMNNLNEEYMKRYYYSSDKDVHKKLVYPFEDIEARNLSLSGGKGASLGLLNYILKDNSSVKIDSCPLEFKIPNGFIISVVAFNDHTQKDEAITESLQKIEKAARNEDNNLLEICECTKKIIEESTMHPEVSSHIREVFKNIEGGGKSFAVRSSGIGEDGEESSTAGQNETFLGLKNIEEILAAVKKCWASLYSYQSVMYRIHHIEPIKSGMAVVVQEMVSSEAAGVLFTRYPTNGDSSKILITGNYGLGESVVSGEVDPDVYVINRNFDNTFEIFSNKLGKKDYAIKITDSEKGTTEKVEINGANRNENCLKPDLALKLAKIGVDLENKYGGARDIEWAIIKNDIYLLQSRPITSLNTMSDWELLHEFDSPVMSVDDLRTNANIGEVLSGVVTPLTQSIFQKGIDSDITEDLTKKQHLGLFNNAIHVSHHNLQMDVYRLFLSVVSKEIDLASRVGGLAIFGHDYITPEIHNIAAHRNGICSASTKFNLFYEMARYVWNNDTCSAELIAFMKEKKNHFSDENLKKFTTAKELLIEIELFLKYFSFVNAAHSHTSRVSMFSQLFALATLAEGKTELNFDHYTDMGLILGSCKNVESADIPKLLKEISNAIYFSGEARTFVELTPSEGEEWLKNNCKEGHRLFRSFISKNYHRALKEFDLVTVTWGMDESAVIQMVQSNLKFLNSFGLGRSAELTDAEIIEQLKTPRKSSTRFILKKILPLCKKSVQYREISKSNFIAYTHELRLAFRYLGTLLFNEGYLPNRNLICFLTLPEIKTLMGSRSFSIINKALRRQKQFPTWNAYKFPELMYGLPKPLEEFSIIEHGGQQVSGTPVCGGTVKGRACVLNSFSEVGKIEMGDILITHSTDIGWSPYFPILAGIVTELGGLISHGAVVAREYGLPCIVGAQNATNLLKFGDRIILDANKGTVVKLNN